MPSKSKHPHTPLIAQVVMETPIGPILLAFSATGLKELTFAGDKDRLDGTSVEATHESLPAPEEVLQNWRLQVKQALENFFAGKPESFEALPLDLQGTPFQLRVWQELCKIPFGETVSYQELARRLGKPDAARAVGQACGINPMPLIVPCHRVIAANGSLGGFSAGLDRKRWLLEHESPTKGESKE